jgi:hypothetical protein
MSVRFRHQGLRVIDTDNVYCIVPSKNIDKAGNTNREGRLSSVDEKEV